MSPQHNTSSSRKHQSVQQRHQASSQDRHGRNIAPPAPQKAPKTSKTSNYSNVQVVSRHLQQLSLFSHTQSTPLRKSSTLFSLINANTWRKHASLSKMTMPLADSDCKWKVSLFLDEKGEKCGVEGFLHERGMHAGGKRDEDSPERRAEASLRLDSGLVVMIGMKSKEWMDYCPTLFGLELDEHLLYIRDEWEREMREEISKEEALALQEESGASIEVDSNEESNEAPTPEVESPDDTPQEVAPAKEEQPVEPLEQEPPAPLLTPEQVQKLPSFINRIVYIYSQVSSYLINGADLMAPGVAQYVDIKSVRDQQQFVGQKRSEINSQKKKKDFLNRSDQIWCLVFVIGNNFPIAVGKWVAKNDDLSSGVAVEILHRYGDAIWEHGRQQGVKDPPGFKRTIVEPVEQEDETPDVRNDQNPEHSTDTDGDEAESDREPLSQQEQDELLKQLFLIALKQTADSEFPLDSAILYTKMLNHPLNSHGEANIKASSWKKVAKFMKEMNNSRLIKGKVQKNVFTVHSVNRSHPDLVAVAASSAESSSQTKSSQKQPQKKKMLIVQMFKFPTNMQFLLRKAQTTSEFGDVFTASQVSEIVGAYLEPHRKGKFIQVPQELLPYLISAYKAFSKRVAKAQRKGLPGQKRDSTLTHCPDPEDSKNAAALEMRFVKALVEESLSPYHGIQYDDESPMKIASGSPKYIEVQVSKIMGNKLITRVKNLSLFNIPYQSSSFHTQLQKKMSSSVKIDPEDNWEVSIQGAKSDELVRYLEKEWGFDTKFIRVENMVKSGGKKKR